MKDLKDIREEIDTIDKELYELFCKRLSLSEEVAEYKAKTGKPVFDPDREKQKLDKISEWCQDSFMEQAARELFSLIMSISKKKQYGILELGEKETSGNMQKKR